MPPCTKGPSAKARRGPPRVPAAVGLSQVVLCGMYWGQMSRSAHSTRRPPKFGVWRRYVLVLLRTLLFSLAVQVSGLSVAVLVGADSCGDELSDCPLEKQGQECPPHCPQCHCMHVNGLVAPASQRVLVSSAAVGARVALERPPSQLVASPLRSNPYRPPRTPPSA